MRVDTALACRTLIYNYGELLRSSARNDQPLRESLCVSTGKTRAFTYLELRTWGRLAYSELNRELRTINSSEFVSNVIPSARFSRKRLAIGVPLMINIIDILITV